MRALAPLTLCALILIGPTVAVVAQTVSEQTKPAAPQLVTPTPSEHKSREAKVYESDTNRPITRDEAKAAGIAWFEQCMRDWDAATHMTKQEWQRTCRRVATERAKFRYEQGQK